jgi:hypothetical protein
MTVPTDTETTEPAEDMQETETPDTGEDTADDAKVGAEAAKYRRRLRDTESERDALAERLSGYQRREAERLAAEHLVRADDVWLAGADVAAVLGDDGEVDPAKVAAVAKTVLDGRPQLGTAWRPRPKPDDAQGAFRGKPGTSWGDVLKAQK